MVLSSPAERQLSAPQRDVLEAGLLNSGFSCVLQMPTGSGKTWLAEQAIAQTLSTGQRAIYLTPLRALADELTKKWQSQLSPHRVGVFTGDYGDRAYPISYDQADLMVMTPEKLDACTRRWRSHWSWLTEVDLLVVDELHLLGDSNRGPRLEGALLRLIRLNPFVRILGLSATLGNRQELANWLNAVEYGSNWRPIPLTWRVCRYKKAQEKCDLLLGEVQQNVRGGGKSLVFVQSRRRAETIAQLLREAGIQTAHHHAGLEHGARRKIEESFRRGNLDVLVATPTLEMGVNLPVRQVILYDLQRFDGVDFSPLPVNNVWQRAGRAGRPGLDEVGEVVLIAPCWARQVEYYAEGKFEAIRSGLGNTTALAEQVVTEVGSGLCRTIGQLESVLAQTLAARQGSELQVKAIVAEMLAAEMLAEVEVRGQFRLKATKLGYVAIRHMLLPSSVLLFKQVMESDKPLSFLDWLILAASSMDCQPLIPVDFEQLDELEESLFEEPSFLLSLKHLELAQTLGVDGKRLLMAINTAWIARLWTRTGDSEQVAKASGCYSFEVDCLRDSLQRLLAAMTEIATVLQQAISAQGHEAHFVSHNEKIKVLEKMVSSGLDEQGVTLTLVAGIGAKLAKRLQQSGVVDVEDLALAEPLSLCQVPGIGEKRATQWIEVAEEIVDSHCSAHRYLEDKTVLREAPEKPGGTWPKDVEPYRLRRALELKVSGHEGNLYRVTGGSDPHRVSIRQAQFRCDCPDFAKGHSCKHIFAVRLFRGDPVLQNLVDTLTDEVDGSGLKLRQLWMSKE